MKDLIREVKELEKRITSEQRTVDVCARTVDEDGLFWREYREHPDRCEQLIQWLTELLEIKKARLSVEVFSEKEYAFEPDKSDSEDLLPIPCLRCWSHSGLTERDGKLICPSCGCVAKKQSQI